LKNSKSLFTRVYRIVQHFLRERTMKMTLMEFAFCPEHSFPRLTDLEFVIEILIFLTMPFFSYTVREILKKVSHRPACPLVVLSTRIFLFLNLTSLVGDYIYCFLSFFSYKKIFSAVSEWVDIVSKSGSTESASSSTVLGPSSWDCVPAV
jgi:hypothetical protein